SHLITLVLVAVLPLLLFSAIVVGLAADSERDATERGLRATGRAVSSAVDHTLDNAIGALEVLATSELLDGGDLPGFHKVAARALEGQRGWLSVAVVDRAGRQVLNTLRPTGAELPPPADARTVAAVLARRTHAGPRRREASHRVQSARERGLDGVSRDPHGDDGRRVQALAGDIDRRRSRVPGGGYRAGGRRRPSPDGADRRTLDGGGAARSRPAAGHAAGQSGRGGRRPRRRAHGRRAPPA